MSEQVYATYRGFQSLALMWNQVPPRALERTPRKAAASASLMALRRTSCERGARMRESRRVNIGVIGAGFIAETRARAYAGVSGYDARIAAVAGRSKDRAADYARR